MSVTLTKKLLADNLAEKVGSKKAATELVNEIFEEMANTLKDGGSVEISGFGKFEAKERAARTGINPITKENINIPAKRVPAFKASKTLKDLVK